jgi:hypothetical protein
MSSLKSKDRVSLCMFSFADGRRCRTPRVRNNPHFCFYHAQKEARARAAQSLGKDLAYFFSGDYLSACDLSTALGRLIPAVIRGDVKPRAARTVAYLAQTLLQAIHLSKHEYTNAFGTDHWRQSIHNSVKGNYDYRFPPAPKPAPPASPQPPPQPAPTPVNCHSDGVAQAFRSEEPAFPPSPAPQPTQSPQSEIPPAPSISGTLSGPASSPRTPLPPTSAEFAQNVLASRNLSRPGRETATGQPPKPAQTPPSHPVVAPLNCYPACPDLVGERNDERPTSGASPESYREGSASSSSPLVTRPSPLPQAQQSVIPTLSGPASASPSTPPQPASVAQPCVSLALPLPIRRRLHRAPA